MLDSTILSSNLVMFSAIPLMILAFWAQFNVSSSFKKYSRIRNSSGITGAQAAAEILRRNGITDVRVEKVASGDHYDPTAKAIRLSPENYENASLCSIAVAAHEAGHAIQHHVNYGGMQLRWLFLKPAQLGSSFGIPLAIGGIFFQAPMLIDIGIIFYLGAVLFQVVTLPVEFNASSRAMVQMQEANLLVGDEIRGARKLLNAAALTYVAAAAVAIGELLRLILIRSSMDD